MNGQGILWSGLLSLAMLAGGSTAFAEERVEMISREVLFGNPDRAGAQLSPDGTKLSFLAPVDGVLNVWVAPIDDPSRATPVTEDRGRGVRNYFWAYTNDHILYLQDKGGDEDWRLYVTDLKTLKTMDLTPFDEIPGPDGQPLRGPDGKKLKPTVQVSELHHEHPNKILIGLNNRNPQLHDLYLVNILTGDMELVEQNDEGFVGYVTDEFEPKLAMRFLPTGGSQMVSTDGKGSWSVLMECGVEDSMNTAPLGFDESGEKIFMFDSRDRNTSAVFAVDLDSGERELIAEDGRADASGIMYHPMKKEIEAVSFTYDRVNWKTLDDAVARDFSQLRRVADGDFSVTSRSLDDKDWIVVYVMDDGPVRYYHYDREEKRANFLFTNRPALEDLPLSKMHPVVIRARDGLNLVSYYTLPAWSDTDGDGIPSQALPTVLWVHGGPWARDSWGYNPVHQWLANRGYAVLSVNYRGSTGFGKNFMNAANGEWSLAMHDDLIDAVDWAIEKGIADAEKVAIGGGSYGGYATLVGLTVTPEKFACGVDIVGPSSLITLMRNIPPYWYPFLPVMTERVGDVNTVEGRRTLRAASPLTHVDEIVRPLLIGQGANDPRVKQVESDQIVEAMQKRDIPVTYVLYPDEGHGFARPENRLSFFGVMELFLGQHLGGAYEPIGDDFENSSIEVPEGAGQVPGLSSALERR